MTGVLKFSGIVAVVVAAVAALTAGTVRTQAAEQNAQVAIASVYAWQQTQAAYEPTLPALLADAQGNAAITANSSVSYRTSADHRHYVFAQQLGGSVLVGSDTHRFGLKCASYDRACISRVTNAPGLVAAPPLWGTPVGERQTKITDFLPDTLTRQIPSWLLDLLDS